MSHEQKELIIFAIRYGPAILFVLWALLGMLRDLLFERKR